jgi:hypothetical protein
VIERWLEIQDGCVEMRVSCRAFSFEAEQDRTIYSILERQENVRSTDIPLPRRPSLGPRDKFGNMVLVERMLCNSHDGSPSTFT